MKKILLLPLILAALALSALAADVHPALRPPQGAKVALVVFEDLQCPDCRRAAPLLEEAARRYNIPLVRHDFPLRQHNWARRAAILARFFDARSKELGNKFRDFIFENQPEITPQNIGDYAQRFAAEHEVLLPFLVDPEGELEKKVQADVDLGYEVGIRHTPTIYVVSNAKTGTPFVEVVDRRQLFAQIDEMLRQAD